MLLEQQEKKEQAARRLTSKEDMEKNADLYEELCTTYHKKSKSLAIDFRVIAKEDQDSDTTGGDELETSYSKTSSESTKDKNGGRSPPSGDLD